VRALLVDGPAVGLNGQRMGTRGCPLNVPPFFSYYGGKWRVAPRYPPPEHEIVIEPFAGAAGYSLRYADRRVYLFDKDEVVIGLWKYLIGVSEDEIRSLPDIELDKTTHDYPLIPEQKWLIGWWCNPGTSRPRIRPSSWMKNRSSGLLYWGSGVRERIAAHLWRIRHWKAEVCSYDHIPIEGPATWFIDPPYYLQGKHYRYGSRGIDYKRLGSWCRDRRGQVIVCEQDSASWLPFDRKIQVKSANGKQKGTRTSSSETWWYMVSQRGSQGRTAEILKKY